MRLFGTSGIRGDAEKLFTNQFCFDLGRTFTQFLDKHQQAGPIAVGMDPRKSSQRIKEALFQGLALSGRELFDEGILPVPAMNWLLKKASLAGTIMVTGSHVKAELNGFKFFVFNEEVLKPHEAEITKIYQELKEKVSYQEKEIKVVQEKKGAQLYQAMLLGLAKKPFPQWKVVVDPGNGSQSETMPRVLEKLGLQVVAINTEPVPEKFMSRDTEAGEAFEEMTRLVRQHQAYLGIIFDADGDRVVFIDEKGGLIPGDYSGSLIAQYSETPIVITPINTSQVVEKIGKKVIRTKVGSPYVVEIMKKNQATFGFEGNGGGVSGEIMMTRDGGSSTIKILNIMKQTGKPLSELISVFPKFFIAKAKVDCPWAIAPMIIKKAKKKFKGIKTEELDGLKIWLDETSWILLRSSSNAPEFRVFAEAATQEEATKLVQDGIEFVKELIKKKS